MVDLNVPAMRADEIQWACEVRSDSGRVRGLFGDRGLLVGFVLGLQEVASQVLVPRAIVVGDVSGVAFGCSRRNWWTAFC